ncbi:MAG: protein adenylyltransferase SelO [Candidatus Izemoplasmataceae bacterium]
MQTYGFNIKDTYRTLPSIFYTDQVLIKFANPSLVLFNDALASNLKIDKIKLNSPDGCRFLLGQTALGIVKPLSMAYAGHQYAHFNILGDGRAHLLLEHLTDDGLVDVHLKGSGTTPYSRGFDGRATLRSALLEFLMSEAMHAMGVSTTRSLAVIKTGDKINRIGLQDAAVLVRTAMSHLRVGTFEYAVYKEDESALKSLADYAIKRHDPDLISSNDAYLTWYQRVIERQAKLIAHWQSIGFVHGVMNTDNMTISGETIDYGPCAFLDHFDLNAVYSSIDSNGRYAFGNQPYIGSWNLAKFGQMILPLIDSNHEIALKKVQHALEQFGYLFEDHYYKMMTKKLGISKMIDSDIPLVDDLLKLMQTYKVDYTETLVSLAFQDYSSDEFFETHAFKTWDSVWKKRINSENNPFDLMKKHNPIIIPRNQIVKRILDHVMSNGNLEVYNDYLNVLRDPFNPDVSKKYREVPLLDTEFVTYCGT